MSQDPKSPDGGPASDAIQLTDAIAHLLGNRRRIAMLQDLSQHDLTATEIGELHGMTATNTLHYLHQLRSHGWVEVAQIIPTATAGAFEYRWRATPGPDWAHVAGYLNTLEAQLEPSPDAAP